ncbi:MAG: nucleotidyltransferase family protein [candidate division WS1 bacterium]|nr:nucleotidyltransferase family protein [candidate division WS1 bacterium]
MRRDREWKLFLDLCAPLSHELSDLPEPTEWARMLGRLEQTRFEALAYHNLRARGLDDAVPGAVMAHLRAANAQALARYHLLGEMVSPHLEALAEAVDFLVLKGTAWAHTVYPEPHLRQSGDIDLLVKDEDQDRAGGVLESRGFDVRWGRWRDHGPQFSLLIPRAGVVYIELHPALGKAADHPHVCAAEAWSRAQSLVMWGVDHRSPDSTLGIAHLAAQLATDVYMRPYIRYLVDLRYLSGDSGIATEELAGILAAGGLCGLAYCAATLADAAVPMPRPRVAARLATALIAAAGWEVRLAMPTGWWGIASRVAALMLFDRNKDRALRLRSYAAHAWARRKHHPRG